MPQQLLEMGKKNRKENSYVTAETYKINKKKSFKHNLEAYTKYLKSKNPNLTTREYLKQIHIFVADQLKKKSGISQQLIVETTSKIKVCKKCAKWIMGTKKMTQCGMCEDYYHIQCVGQAQDNMDWRCIHCIQIIRTSQNKDQSTQSSEMTQYCRKCNGNKNQKLTKCTKCKLSFHKSCSQNLNKQCFDCSIKSKDKVSQNKQLSILQSFKSSKEKTKKMQNEKAQTTKETKQESKGNGHFPTSLKLFGQSFQSSRQQLKVVDKEQIQQSTNASSIFPERTKRFTHNFPKMNPGQIKHYRDLLEAAIETKEMNYVENLVPSNNIQLKSDSQNSLDFGLKFLCLSDWKKYLQYKNQPIGPFRIQYEKKWGYDVVADKDLPKGMIICQYVGDVYTHRQALKVAKENDSVMQLFIGKNADESLLIVPKQNTNIARFINGINQYDPKSIEKQNVSTVRVMSRQGHPIVILYTCRAVKKGERLLYNYGAGLVDSKYDTSEYC